MNWQELLTAKRFGQNNHKALNITSTRTEFQRDYDRIIFSSPFRRLQNKTQVFPLPGKVFVHNRLTHSLEVASVGRSLGNVVAEKLIQGGLTADPMINEIGTIISAACLAHDMGNPPFGHSGEEAISSYFAKNEALIKPKLSEAEWQDFVNFDGNANAFHLLTTKFKGRRAGGFGLTLPTLASIVKYPYEAQYAVKKNKFGFFQADKEAYEMIANELSISKNDKNNTFNRYPLVYLVEAADDICYQLMDFEDAHKLGILATNEIIELFKGFFNNTEDKATLDKIENTFKEVTDTNEQIGYLRAIIINKLIFECADVYISNYAAIMKGTYSSTLIKDINPDTYECYKHIQNIAIKRIYKHKTVVEIELSGYQIIGILLAEFAEAVLEPNSSYSKKLLSVMPLQYKIENESVYQKLLSVTDFISGMTDVYALDLYRTIKGINIPSI